MDIELLITKVFERSPIWDKGHKEYGNRNVMEKLWKEISEEMNKDELSLRKIWKYLQDQFSVELQKGLPSQSGDADESYGSKEPYIQSLMFLKDTVRPETSAGVLSQQSMTSISEESCPTPTREIESYDSVICDGDACHLRLNSAGNEAFDEAHGDENLPPQSVSPSGTHVMQSTPPAPSSPTVVYQRKRPTESCMFQNKMLEIEKEKLDVLKERRKRSNDDDELFVLSLVPHFKKIPDKERMILKKDIMNLVCDRVYGNDQ